MAGQKPTERPTPMVQRPAPTGAAPSRGGLRLSGLLMAVAAAVAVSLPAIGLLKSGERTRCDAYLPAPEGLTLIAHAGGGLAQGDYSNSLETLNQSLGHGFGLFEIDFIWTGDGALAIGHDWGGEYRYWNRLDWGAWLASFFKTPSSAEHAATPPAFGLTRLSLDSLIDWLRTHPGRIVTDFKSGNIDGLALIAEKAGELRDRFIPQIYGMSEYDAVRALGYDDIIFTTYRLSPDANMYARIDALDLLAVTVPASRLEAAAASISAHPVFTHTINSPVTLPSSGYYTDCLIPYGAPPSP